MVKVALPDPSDNAIRAHEHSMLLPLLGASMLLVLAIERLPAANLFLGLAVTP